MKKVYIPSGESVSHLYLYTDRLIVKGVLQVSGKIVAKEILGGGIIEAREIVCDTLHAGSVTADFVTAARVVAHMLFVRFECRASEQVAVTDYVGAGYISTGKLSMTLSDVSSCDADEVITLRQRRRGLLGFLWASWWRGLFLELFHKDGKKATEKKPSEKTDPKPFTPSPKDVDMADLVIDVLTALKGQGYEVSKTAVPAPEQKEVAA